MMLFGTKCGRIRQLLSFRLDEPLSAGKEEAVIRHLHSCAECREWSAFLTQLKDSAGKLKRAPVPEYLWERISLTVGEHRDNSGRLTEVRFAEPARPLIGTINFAGIVLTCLTITFLCLLPGGTREPDSKASYDSLRAEDNDPGTAYVSMYLMTQGSQFPLEIRDYYVEQLNGLDQNIDLIKTALRRYPHNAQIKAQLASAYRQKIKVYRQIGCLTGGDFLTIIPGDVGYEYARGKLYD